MPEVRLVWMPPADATDDGEERLHEVVETAAVRVDQHRNGRPRSTRFEGEAEVNGRAGQAAAVDPESIQLGDVAERASDGLQEQRRHEQPARRRTLRVGSREPRHRAVQVDGGG
jgi:hypothetical protein